MASFYLAPDPIQSTQLIPGGNTPANGGQLFVYTAGSSAKVTVYKDNAGSSQWTNPIVLDSGGNLPLGGLVWIPTGVSIKVVFAPSTDTDPPVSPYWTRDNLVGINDTSSSASEWITGPTPTFVSATQFTLVGDQTGTFMVGRRVKTTNTGGTVYSRISASAFGALTTVTVVNDSGTLDSGLSAVSYGLLAPTNPSIPLLTDAYPIVSGSADKTKILRLEVDGLTTATTRVWTAADRDIALGKFPTRQEFTAVTTATYSTPAGAIRIVARYVAGGGGGGGGAGAGTTGSTSTFNSVSANGGVGGGTGGGNGGAGGDAGAGTASLRARGNGGQGGTDAAATNAAGGIGGGSAFFGGGANSNFNAAGSAGKTNTGGGGAGGSGSSGGAVAPNAGGGGGESVELIINTPASSYAYTVGAAGPGGGAGTGQAGGAGGSGYLFVDEYYC